MKFTVDKQEHYTVFKLEEEKLNSLMAPLLKSEMIVLNAEGVKNVIFDMQAIRFVDSSGLSSILITNRLCTNSGGSLVLTGVAENVVKLIKISQLDSILNCVPTMQEAIDFVIMNDIENDFDGN